MSFYSYMWLRANGTPYYVGKGRNRRAFIGSAHGVHRPKDPSRILVFPMLNETEAFESEKALIELFGRKDNGTGILRNLTDGGDGVSGFVCTEWLRQRRKEFQTGRRASEKARLNMSRAQQELALTRNMTGVNNPAFGKKRPDLSEFNTKTKRGKTLSVETRRKMSQAHAGKSLTSEHIERIKQGWVERRTNVSL